MNQVPTILIILMRLCYTFRLIMQGWHNTSPSQPTTNPCQCAAQADSWTFRMWSWGV
ncbi:hypothetical protein BGY98DRAFT_972897, partial [Russula aff. rugulosa BPL654]